ncbi:MAG: hydroxymethylbilane synthase [Anaerolineae bacterium]|jgi:hydroxymethylbilane synthase|nr:hydroxymethylbilane synthase [Anaerolineae bacterium]
MHLRFGTRGSDLARWQTDYIAGLLSAHSAEIHVFSTTGDRILDTPLPQVGGKGLFTAELEAALRTGSIDLAVHSLKDLPTEPPPDLQIGAIPPRANPFDALISPQGYTFETLPKGAIIGTSSPRRSAQLRYLRPDLQIKDIRGNVDTRLRKALTKDYDAIILACAGLERLGLSDAISEVLSPDVMLPAPGQGALAVQCRDETTILEVLAPIHDWRTAYAVIAERAFLARLGGGCAVPIGAYGEWHDGWLHLSGRITQEQAKLEVNWQGPVDSEGAALAAGIALAIQAFDQDAQALL